MIIYPDIELQKGRCVHLYRGAAEEPVVHNETPLDAAKRFAAEGAQWLNVIDLDRVFGDGDNTDQIVEIIKTVGRPVQVGGGVCNIDQVRAWVDAGAGRVVIASAAVKDPAFVVEAANRYPDQIVVSVDIMDGHVAIDGWRNPTAFSPVDFAVQFQDAPLAAMILTDIDRDIDAPNSSIHHVAELSHHVRTPVIASGVVKELDDISTLKFLPNVAGAIVGRALFSEAITLEDALRIAEEPTPAVAPFV